MAISQRDYENATILSAAATTGAGTAFNVAKYRHVVLSFATDGGGDAALTVKFQGSIQEAKPAFGSAASVTNHWDYIQVVDLQDGSGINGDTGIAVAGADDYRLVEMNVNGLNWINANVTARTEGEVTVRVLAFKD